MGRGFTSIHYLLIAIAATSIFIFGIFAANPVPQFAPGEVVVPRFSGIELALIGISGIVWVVLVAALLITLYMHHRHNSQFKELVNRSMPAQQMKPLQPAQIRPMQFANPQPRPQAPQTQQPQQQQSQNPFNQLNFRRP